MESAECDTTNAVERATPDAPERIGHRGAARWKRRVEMRNPGSRGSASRRAGARPHHA